jgi:hypothetical protein
MEGSKYKETSQDWRLLLHRNQIKCSEITRGRRKRDDVIAAERCRTQYTQRGLLRDALLLCTRAPSLSAVPTYGKCIRLGILFRRLLWYECKTLAW